MAVDLAERLAPAVSDAWWQVCEQPRPWAANSVEQQLTFRRMAEYALRSARAGQKAEAAVARAMCEAFWLDHPRPWPWDTLSGTKRQVFVLVARAVIAAGQAMRSAPARAAA